MKPALLVTFSSRDNNRVSWFHDDVLLHGLALYQSFVVYRDLLLPAVLRAQNINALGIRELRETGVSQRLQHSHVGQQLNSSGMLHLSRNINLLAVNLRDYHGDPRIGNKFSQLLGNRSRQL